MIPNRNRYRTCLQEGDGEMILKTKGVDEITLQKQAKASIKFYAKPEDDFCFIPYLDVPDAKIRYLRFKLVNKKWVMI